VRRLFEDRAEHRRKVSRRRVDDLQDLSGGDLLGESLITLYRFLS
jgi:hypothetical protein